MTTPAAPPDRTVPRSRGPWWYAGVVVLVATAAIAAFVFYFGGYSYLLSGDSASFTVEWSLAQARVHRDASVVVLGNSTAAEGFRPNWFKSHGSGAVAVNLGVPSGWIFLWQRMLETALNMGLRPRSVVVMLTPEIISTTEFDFLLNDLAMLKTVVDTSDLPRLAPYASSRRQYLDYAEAVVGRPVLFRAELRDFVTHPVGRLREAKHIHDWIRSFNSQSPMIETDNKFSICQAGPLRELDQTIEKFTKESNPLAPDLARVKAGYGIRLHQVLRIDAHKLDLLRQLLAEIEAHHMTAFVMEAPFWDPDFDQYPAAYRHEFSSTIQRLVRNVPGATYLPKLDVDCSMMLDTVHLNRKGGEIFTEYLLTRVL
jgi:hypothetical protein